MVWELKCGRGLICKLGVMWPLSTNQGDYTRSVLILLLMAISGRSGSLRRHQNKWQRRLLLALVIYQLLGSCDHSYRRWPGAGAGRRLLTSYNVLGSQPTQSKGLFGPVALTGQRALLARYRSHTLFDFRFSAPFARSLRLLLSHGNTLFPFTDLVRPLYSTRIYTVTQKTRH